MMNEQMYMEIFKSLLKRNIGMKKNFMNIGKNLYLSWVKLINWFKWYGDSRICRRINLKTLDNTKCGNIEKFIRDEVKHKKEN